MSTPPPPGARPDPAADVGAWGYVTDVPPALAGHAQAWLAAGGTPVPAKASATVLLVRDDEAGQLEVFVQRRAASMAFAASAYVFPGGGVDARDADPRLPWAGPSPAQWARLLVASEDEARELVVAAARELFEECGVLLAGPDAGSLVGDVTAAEWAAERRRLLDREASFAQVLTERGLVLRTDLLRAVDHWVTPEFEPRRYATRFLAAALPAGQVPDDDCTEADHVRWVRPADLVAEADAGDALLFPPTRVNLLRAARAGSAADYLAAAGRRPVPPVLLQLVPGPDGPLLVHPDALG